MKKTYYIITFLATFLLMSCSSPLSTRFESYVTQVETDCKYWTDADWKISQEEYSLLLQEYEENYSTLSQEEKDAINKAIGRYNGLLIKQGIEDATNVLQEFGERLPSLIEGFMSAFGENENE